MYKMALADGKIDPSEITLIAGTLSRLTKIDIKPDDIAKDLEVAKKDSRSIKNYVEEMAPLLRDSGKEIVLRAAISVAKADGNVDKSELEELHSLAKALKFPTAYANGIFAEENITAVAGNSIDSSFKKEPYQAERESSLTSSHLRLNGEPRKGSKEYSALKKKENSATLKRFAAIILVISFLVGIFYLNKFLGNKKQRDNLVNTHFALFDLNNDEQISIEEIDEVALNGAANASGRIGATSNQMDHFGQLGVYYSPERGREELASIDNDGDGVISREEHRESFFRNGRFSTGRHLMYRQLRRELLASEGAMLPHDLNKDGGLEGEDIEHANLRNISSSLRENAPQLTIENHDINANARIDPEEYALWIEELATWREAWESDRAYRRYATFIDSVYARMDNDRNGNISQAEIYHAVGYDPKSEEIPYITSLMNVGDIDSDETLNRTEFNDMIVAQISSFQIRPNARGLISDFAFSSLDMDNSEHLERRELEFFFSLQADTQSNTRQTQIVISRGDRDHDGKLSRTEYYNIADIFPPKSET